MIFTSFNCFAQRHKSVVTDDIPNFWKAYDQIIQTKDSTRQIELINALYISKGSPGLQAIMQARRYTAQSYVNAINKYPLFWGSIRNNTLKADNYAKEIEKGIEKLKKVYPSLKPAKIYFTIGAFRTNGTTIADKVLIGSELAMADKSIVTNEIEMDYPHLKSFFETSPISDLTFLNTHEYIHTQQKTTIGNSLLAQAVLEGAAEFVAEKALNMKSPNPQINFGQSMDDRLKSEFTKEMFTSDFRNWLWNSSDNKFGMRDLGYYIGYAICKNYYDASKIKKQAIEEMIELDYNNETELFKFVDRATYFEKPISYYESLRPQVISIKQFENGSQTVHPNTTTITIHFSQPMNVNTRGFEFGPLGEENVLMIQKVIGFSEDRKSFSFEVKMEPNKRYQSLVSKRFTDEAGIPLKPYLIDIKTAP
ncbi:hypothetical protein C1N53_03340 [Pontibacter sp. SGAir0037]|nr:hypothetical protein C1N53_03340 [Pontibacter sp. SGAir0037]